MSQEQPVMAVSELERIESDRPEPITLSNGMQYVPKTRGKISPRQIVRATAIMKEMYRAQIATTELQNRMSDDIASNNPDDMDLLMSAPEKMLLLSIEMAQMALVDPPSQDELMDFPQDDIDELQAFLLGLLGADRDQSLQAAP